MTVHVPVRSISALLLLGVSLLGLPADALAQSVVAPHKAAPTLAERLDRLATEFDRIRIDLHVPGAVLAIVRGEEVIFARGFGVADIEKEDGRHAGYAVLHRLGHEGVHRDARRDAGGRGADAVGRSG
jgi:CubicO group peptidase (beta-lactamase class C family)